MKEIYTDNDPELHLEFPSVAQKIKKVFLVPILNNLPGKLLPLAVKTHRSGAKLVEQKTNHLALEILYQSGTIFKSRNIFEKIAFWVWFGLDNPRAVRNRLRIVKREIQTRLSFDLQSSDEVSILSIAAGSARAILESVANVIEKYGEKKIYITFLDKNPDAATYNKALANELGLLNHPDIEITWITDTINSYIDNVGIKTKFNIIEMVGLLDYFNDKNAIKVFKNIKSSLISGGMFICANIDDNSERKFITNFIGWKMEYRSASELVSLLVLSGFNRNSIRAFYEPLKIHSITCANNDVFLG